MDFVKKIEIMDLFIDRSINEDILNNSILLIGPMGIGKSSVSKNLQTQTGLPVISLDDRNQLQQFY